MITVSTELHSRYTGIIQAIKKISTDFYSWNPKAYPVFDLLTDIKPDIVFIDLKCINNLMIEAFNTYKTKIVLFGQGVPNNLVPAAVIAQPNTSKVIRRNIESQDYPTLYLHDSANVVDIFNGSINHNMSCEVGYIFDNMDADKYIQQILLLSYVSKCCKLKIVGQGRIPLPQYIGNIQTNSISSFYKSASIILDFEGSQILDIAANRGFAISTVPNRLYPCFEDISSIDNVQKQIKAILNADYIEIKNDIARQAQIAILQQDTCYHRLCQILEAVNMTDMVSTIHQTLQDTILCKLE